MGELTVSQKLTFDAIVNFIDANCYAPTISEIASARGVGRNAVFEQLGILKKKGFIEYKPRASRTIRVL